MAKRHSLHGSNILHSSVWDTHEIKVVNCTKQSWTLLRPSSSTLRLQNPTLWVFSPGVEVWSDHMGRYKRAAQSHSAKRYTKCDIPRPLNANALSLMTERLLRLVLARPERCRNPPGNPHGHTTSSPEPSPPEPNLTALSKSGPNPKVKKFPKKTVYTLESLNDLIFSISPTLILELAVTIQRKRSQVGKFKCEVQTTKDMYQNLK